MVIMGYGVSGSASYSKSKVNADYASVNEQSGIFAGEDGYQINVQNHTDLKGGLITSTQKSEDDDKNRFTTGTLTFEDLANKSEYSGSGFGIGVSGSVKGNAPDNSHIMQVSNKTGVSHNGIGYASDSDSQSSVTKSGINTANIVITDTAKQQQITGKTAEETLKAVKTDITTDNYAEHSGSLKNNFDKDKVQNEIDLQVEVTKQAAPMIAQGVAFASDYLGKVKQYENKLLQKDLLEQAINQSNDPEEILRLNQALNEVDSYLTENKARYDLFKEGGLDRAGLHAVGGGVLTGDISGAAGAGVTSLSAPIIAQVADNSGSLKPVVDTVSGLAIGYTTGGTAGAFTGANADWNNRQLHPDETRLLNKLKQGKSAEEQYRLDAAACALTRCADGVPSSDEYYKVLKDLQTAGEQFTAEKTLLQQQGAGLNNGKFQYSLTNGSFDDFITGKDKAISKVSGAADAVLGSATVVAGYGIAAGGCAATGIETAGAGCVVSVAGGSALAGLGYMQTKSGTERLLTKYNSPYGNIVLQSLVQPTEYYSASNNAAGNVALWTAESFALKGLGKVLNGGKTTVTTGRNSAGKANNPQSAATTPPVTSNGAANIATGEKLNLDLKTTQAANEVVESLRTTGQLPSHYITKTQAESNGWYPGKALNNTNPGKQIGGDIYKNNPVNGVNVVPNANGRVWYEADIGISNTMSRAKQDGTRLLYSNDGLLYISTDHYQSPAHYIGRWK